jgi:hypothetical protein
MSSYLRPATWIFLGVWLVLLVGGRSRFFQDPGTFWHVAVGDRIIDTGFFDTDPYTFTFQGHKWIPHQWLGECTMAVVHRIGGFDSLLLGTATLLAAVYGGIGVRLMRAGLHPSVVAVVLALGVASSSGHFHVRPHLATIAGMAIFMIFLADVENGRIPIGRLVWLVPVTWLWSNTHGGVLGGLATIALTIGGWTAARLIKRDSPIKDRRDFLRCVGIWLACAATCFANPYFYRLPWSWIEIYQMSSLPDVIVEHSRLKVREWAGITVVAFGVVYCLLLSTVPIRRFRVTWLLPIVWFALAWMRVRHAPLFAVLALIAIADLFPYTRVAAYLVRRKSDLYAPANENEPPLSASAQARPFAIPAAIILAALVLQWAGASVPVLGRGWAQHDPKRWPVELIPELREHQNDRPTGARIFCEYTYGGFIIYHAPGYRVFIDDRCELFGDDFLVKFVGIELELRANVYSNPAEPFAEWQAQYGSFDMALVATDGGFDRGLASMPVAWEVVRRTDTATLYKKVQFK